MSSETNEKCWELQFDIEVMEDQTKMADGGALESSSFIIILLLSFTPVYVDENRIKQILTAKITNEPEWLKDPTPYFILMKLVN